MVSSTTLFGRFHFLFNRVLLFLLLLLLIAITVLDANRVDPDQTSRSAASDLDPPCFLMFLLCGARYKRVKGNICSRENTPSNCFSFF